jgi:hypothetical protein
LLCIEHLLSLKKGDSAFILDAKPQFAPTLAQAIRSSDPEEKCPWLLAIVGVSEFREPKGLGLRGLFQISKDYTQVKFHAEQCAGAEFHFFLGKQEITDKPAVLAALVRAIQGNEENLFPLELPEEVPPPAPLSLHIQLPGHGFLSVRTPETAKLLRDCGLLPLPHNAAAQLHVRFELPRHFCLFAFGSDQKVHAYVPHPTLQTGQARDGLIIPGDLVKGMDELAFEGAGGAESFLLLVSPEAITEVKAKATHKTIGRIVGQVGQIRLPDTAVAFVKDESLSVTKALSLSSARPLSNPLDRLLADLRRELSGHFSTLHFVSVHRRDPPQPGR